MIRPRAKALRFLRRRRGITEQPSGSNTDARPRGIRWMQLRAAAGGSWLIGLPWCGTAAVAAALHAGVHIPQPWRWASVANIEDDAHNARNGFRGWTTNPRRALRGDLVVLYGRGIHVETIVKVLPRLGVVITYGGNTSSGNSGSQDNGGGLFRRTRSLGDVHGIALVNYPG